MLGDCYDSLIQPGLISSSDSLSKKEYLSVKQDLRREFSNLKESDPSSFVEARVFSDDEVYSP